MYIPGCRHSDVRVSPNLNSDVSNASARRIHTTPHPWLIWGEQLKLASSTPPSSLVDENCMKNFVVE